MMDNLKCEKIEIQNLRIHRNCAIGHLEENEFIVGGGYKSSGKFSRKVYKINPIQKTSTPLPPLKIKTENGRFFFIDLVLFYISVDLNFPHQVLKNGHWEILTQEKLNLRYSEVYSIGSKIFFAFGIKKNKKPTKKIWSLDLDSRLVYKLEEKLKFKLIKPIIGTFDQLIIIAGGTDVNKKPNYTIYIKSLQDENWFDFIGPKFLYERIPCVVREERFIFLSKCQKFVTISEKLEVHEFNYQIDKKSLNNNRQKPPKLVKYRRNSANLSSILNNSINLRQNYVHNYAPVISDDEQSDRFLEACDKVDLNFFHANGTEKTLNSIN